MRTHRTLTVVALLLSMFMGAMEMTVVSTAMPTVVADLGGIHLYSWVFAAYMLGATVTVPIYGKLADLFGRKPVLLFGLGLFLLGSSLSGIAPSMTALIGFRALQGLGAGAMQPVALTIVGDLFTLEQRARMQGLFGAVWGVAGISGPMLGGLIVEHLSWHWIFWINVPVGLASMALLSTSLHENVEKRKHALDGRGAILLTAAIVALLAGTRGGGAGATSLAACALFVALFIRTERRAPEPLLPPDLFRHHVILVASVAGALVGGAMMATVTYVPLYVQGVMRRDPTAAASAVTPMVVGWPIASALAGRLLGRLGFRTLVRGGLLLASAAALLLASLLGPQVSLRVPQAAMVLFGAGLGFANTALIIALQTAVPWNRRGIATASTMFFRTIGGTIAIGVLGSILSVFLARDPSIPASAADELLGPEHGSRLDPETLRVLSTALESGLGVAFWAVFGISLAAFGVSLFFRRGELGEAAEGEEIRATAGGR